MIFDLKGSTKGRKTEVSDRFWRRDKDGRGQVLKDLNYVEINNDLGGRLMQLGKDQVKDLDDRLKKDSAFLARHNLMDYSVLLGIEEVVEEPVVNLPANNPQECGTGGRLTALS